ncbi:MAG: DUF885 domain-containing protein [Lachnospiraceae bacterium]|nr:DUF885 domain-containing protein [Lachnospiraceae bacterium]
MKLRRFFCFCLVIISSVLLSCCNTQHDTPEEKPSAGSYEFTQLTNRMFTEYLSGNTVNMHSMVLSPEDFGINDYQVTLGDFSLEGFKNTNNELCRSLQELNKIDYDSLNDSEKLTYNILKTKFADSLQYCDYYMLDEYLSASDGQQQLLPVYLAEYSFNSEKDILDYLQILQLSEEFFSGLLEFEKLKADNGTFMNEFQADNVINQCNEFIKDKENHYLITTFNDRIKELEYLSDDKKNSYISLNKKYLEQYYFPSYENIASTMNTLKKSSKNLGGMCNYENGKIYYEGLVRTKTGSPKSVADIQAMLENALATDTIRIHEIYSSNPDIDKHLKDFSNEYKDIKSTIGNLHKNISEHFPEPAVKSSDVQVHSVPESMEKYEAPAYYLSPPIDCLTKNSIYINGLNYNGKSITELIPVLAHEGFPGHLYQTTYFRNTKPDNIRLVQSFPGYAEGWGTYAEIYSYYITGLDETAAEYNARYTSLALELYSLIDIYVNYNGWNLNKLMEYGKSWGFDDNASIKIYHAVIESPCSYLQYSVGYLEILNLKEKAMEQLGDKFSIKAFHKFLLDTGPAQFEIIERQMEDWINSLPSVLYSYYYFSDSGRHLYYRTTFEIGFVHVDFRVIPPSVLTDLILK